MQIFGKLICKFAKCLQIFANRDLILKELFLKTKLRVGTGLIPLNFSFQCIFYIKYWCLNFVEKICHLFLSHKIVCKNVTVWTQVEPGTGLVKSESNLQPVKKFQSYKKQFYINANLVILKYLGSPFTWDKVFKVLRLLPNHVKNQRLLVHILYYILFVCAKLRIAMLLWVSHCECALTWTVLFAQSCAKLCCCCCV